MITRLLHGLPFRVISPSFYELASHPEIDISFVGDQWMLQWPDQAGEPVIVCYPTLDECAGVIAEAVALSC